MARRPATPQHQAELLQSLCRAVDLAMAAERIPADARIRVINRIVYGEPTGLNAGAIAEASKGRP